MRAIRIEETGPPSVLRLAEVDAPEPGQGEARVRVHAAGVNFADVVMRSGRIPSALPMVPGVEGAGVVEALGDGVVEAPGAVAVGDRVAWAPVMEAESVVGSYAELECVSADALIPVPDAVPLETAAAVTLQGLTAHYLLHDKKPVGRGTRVLVHAAAGGMGLLLCRWLRRLDAFVIGTTSTPEKAARALELTGGEGVDYVIDGVGRSTFRKNLACMAGQGHICLYGMASGPPEPLSPLELLPKALCVSGGMMTRFLRTREEVLRKGAEVFAGVEAGWLAPPHVDVLPLEQAGRAHERLESRASSGKLVLRVAS